MNIEKLNAAKALIIGAVENGPRTLRDILCAAAAEKLGSYVVRAQADLFREGKIEVVDGLVRAIKVDAASEILVNLRAYAESTSTYLDGSTWASVYLANAKPSTMTPHRFAGYLSTLEARGLYVREDGFFGRVKL